MRKKGETIARTATVLAAAAVALSFSIARAADSAPGTAFRDCPACPEIMVVPAGEFVMGSTLAETGHTDEKPQHTVRIAQAFGVGKFEVTFEQWDSCTKAGRCPAAKDDGYGRGSYPVINVSWRDATAYTKWLSDITGRSYRLLSEAEFEYAARAGTQTPWFWGDAPDSWGSRDACDYANTHDEAGKEAHAMYVWSHHKCNDGYGENGPTGSYKPNAFGLHDMIGNLREWVADCMLVGYEGAPIDGSVRPHQGACEKRVVRGGTWLDGPSTSRSAYRYSEPEDFRNYQLGFRVACELKK